MTTEGYVGRVPWPRWVPGQPADQWLEVVAQGQLRICTASQAGRERAGEAPGEMRGSLETLRGESTHRNFSPNPPTRLGFKTCKGLSKIPGQDPVPAPFLSCGHLRCISPPGWAVTASYTHPGLPAVFSRKSVESERNGHEAAERCLFPIAGRRRKFLSKNKSQGSQGR